MSETSGLWSDEDLCEVVRRELQLLEPEFRSRPAAVLALLHPDFLEFGASGRRWDAPSMAELLAQETSTVASEATDLVPVRLAGDVVLLTYTAQQPERVSLRSSVWLRHPEQGWALRFHQGTTVAWDGRDPLTRHHTTEALNAQIWFLMVWKCAPASTDPDEQKRRGCSGLGFHRHAPCVLGFPFNRWARGPWLGPGREGNLVAVSGADQVRARVGAQERPALSQST